MKFEKSLLAASLTLALAACGGGGSSDPEPTPPPEYEYTAYACDAALYEKAKELRIYQVMTEAFIDGDSNRDYNTAYGNSAHKGDIQGVTDSLDYIQSLGMNAIWLTPVFQSAGGGDEWAQRLDGTGYFASNYFAIDPNFGSLEQARELVNEAHARGMYVFFDGVFGHFKNNAQSYSSPTGATVSTSGASQGDTGREAVYPTDLDFFKEVAVYWINELKIDGWRLDQAYQVPTGAWSEIRKAVEDASKAVTYTMNGQEVNPLGYMVGEIWRGQNDIASQGYGDTEMPGLCSNFDFPMRYRITQTFAVEESGNGGRDASNLASGFGTHIVYPEFAVPNGFLTNHDLVRFGDLLQRGDIAQPADPEYWQRHKAAYAFLAAYSGPITLYYGDEIGDEVPGFANARACDSDGGIASRAGLCDDHVSRSPGKVEGLPSVQGEAVFTADANQADLRDYITELMSIRAANPALYKGERTPISTSESQYVFFDHKASGDNVVLFLSNTSEQDRTVTVTGEAIGSDGQLTNLLSNATIDPVSGEYTIVVPALDSLFLKVESPTAEGPAQGNGDSLTGDGPLADCSAPDVAGDGPLGEGMWIRGNYTGGDGFAATPDTHQFSYKGDNIYQVVVTESSPTSFGFKFASSGWDFEFAAASGSPVIGSEEVMSIATGEGTESNVTIPEAGDYVYSFRINDALTGGQMMISKCE